MTDKTNSAESKGNVALSLAVHVKPAQDGFAFESSVEVHESDPVAAQAGQKPADLQDDLFRFWLMPVKVAVTVFRLFGKH